MGTNDDLTKFRFTVQRGYADRIPAAEPVTTQLSDEGRETFAYLDSIRVAEELLSAYDMDITCNRPGADLLISEGAVHVKADEVASGEIIRTFKNTPKPSGTPTATPTATPDPETTDPNGPNLYTLEIEVNQAVQDLGNRTPLIALKLPTFVRVYFRSDEGIHRGINARLFSDRDPNPIPPWMKETAYPTNIGDTDRHEPVVGSSFLFVLPPNWTFAGESTLTVEINHDRKVIERDYRDNVDFVKVNFEPMPPLKLVTMPVYGDPRDPTLLSGSLDAHWDQVRYALNTYPVASLNIRSAPPFLYLGLLEGAGRARFEALLALHRYWMYSTGELSDDEILVALLHPLELTVVYDQQGNPIGEVLGAVTGIGAPILWLKPTDPTTLAHKIGHALFRLHINYKMPPGHPKDGLDLAYPEDPCRYAGVEIEDYRGLVSIAELLALPRVPRPVLTADFMTYARPAWVSNYTYTNLKQKIGGAAPTKGAFALESAASSPQLIVSGVVSTSARGRNHQRISGRIAEPGIAGRHRRLHHRGAGQGQQKARRDLFRHRAACPAHWRCGSGRLRR